MVEHRPFKAVVEGSSPSILTNNEPLIFINGFFLYNLSKLIEHKRLD